MIKTMRKANVKGFSLVELMVVVAIIGILAAVAIPNFQRFQRKARQAEARTLLGGIHQANQAFHAQWENYSSFLDGIGFVPSGTLRYNAGFTAATAFSSGMAPIGWTGLAGGPGDGVARNDTFTVCMDAMYSGQCTGTNQALAGVVAPAGFGNTAMYTAGASGDIGGAMIDQWTMDQLKVQMNTTDGTL